jgi:hypothetical protein
MVVWQSYLNDMANFLNISSTEAGVIHSIMLTIFAIVMVLVASKGRQAIATVPITAFFGILLFTYMGWFPAWTGAVLAILGTIQFVGSIRNRL